jgi:hypothetical protein
MQKAIQKVVELHRVSSRGRVDQSSPEAELSHAMRMGSLTPSVVIRRLSSRRRVRCLSHVHKRCRRRWAESASCLSQRGARRNTPGASSAAAEKTPAGSRPASSRIAFHANLKPSACERPDPRKVR